MKRNGVEVNFRALGGACSARDGTRSEDPELRGRGRYAPPHVRTLCISLLAGSAAWPRRNPSSQRGEPSRERGGPRGGVQPRSPRRYARVSRLPFL